MLSRIALAIAVPILMLFGLDNPVYLGTGLILWGLLHLEHTIRTTAAQQQTTANAIHERLGRLADRIGP